MSELFSATAVTKKMTPVRIPWLVAHEIYPWLRDVVGENNYSFIHERQFCILFHNEEDKLMFKLKFAL